MLQLNNLCVRHFQRTFIPSRATNPACLPTESSGWMMVLEHVTYPFEAVGLSREQHKCSALCCSLLTLLGRG